MSPKLALSAAISVFALSAFALLSPDSARVAAHAPHSTSGIQAEIPAAPPMPTLRDLLR